MFRISDEEQYRLFVTEKDLKSMCRFSKLGKLISLYYELINENVI